MSGMAESQRVSSARALVKGTTVVIVKDLARLHRIERAATIARRLLRRWMATSDAATLPHDVATRYVVNALSTLEVCGARKRLDRVD